MYRIPLCAILKPFLRSNTRDIISFVSELPSPQRVPTECPAEFKHNEWGFVIYRCTHQDDNAWERFKQIICERLQEIIQESQLREHFNKWAAEAIMIEQPRTKAEIERTIEPTFGIPRSLGGGLRQLWKPLGDGAGSSGIEDDEDEEEVLEPIDGCTEGSVGWMRLVADNLVDAEFYISFYGYPGGGC
ncbi:hypothetical protein MBLNU13_g00904t1 [Cladosporium sp. NU13]